MTLASLLSHWRAEPTIGGNVAEWRTLPPRPARYGETPESLHPRLRAALPARGIENLYIHQVAAFEKAREGRNVVVVTGTASGKTLCYNLPVLDHLLEDPEARALYIFPTKALAQDQKDELDRWMEALGEEAIPVATYDGDTPGKDRPGIRGKARLLISNPDMLHIGVLPYHTKWIEFFSNLRYVVIDELHTYRGVFGSHVANVIRRLKRVADFYGAVPQFTLTSATIGNPVELAEKLTETQIELIDEDGSARGAQHFIIYNPPIVNQELGIRASVLQESVRLAQDLLTYEQQTIIFGRSRRTVEIMLTYLRESGAAAPEQIRGYRSGYLPRQRREIERGLREGAVRAVIATNALELGIDIGGMGAALLTGYPGTIAGTWQQAGRAGRGEDQSLAVLVASANPLDQFLARHPEYFFGRSPEQALINPDNVLILLGHIRSAAFELPFRVGESFGSLEAEQVADLLGFLEEAELLHRSGDKYFWMAGGYPAEGVSLRSASTDRVLLRTFVDDRPVTIGEVDQLSAYWMVHPEAIYLHEGRNYLVEDLDLEGKIASLRPAEVDYYTEPRRETTVSLIEELGYVQSTGGSKAFGEIAVTTQVTGYHKVQWFTHQRLGSGEVDLPPTELQTTGYWLALDEETVNGLRDEGLWRNDPSQYGPNWSTMSERARQRDNFTCQVCGKPEGDRAHDVHHLAPIRTLENYIQANRLENLVTLCPACHRRAERAVRVRSGLAGLSFVLGHLAPLFLMCDRGDLGVHADPKSPLAEGKPAVVLYDQIPAGIGFSERLYELHAEIMARAYALVEECECSDGCPSCVGPGGESGLGGKRETLGILGRMKGG